MTLFHFQKLLLNIIGFQVQNSVTQETKHTMTNEYKGVS